jgi:hypothetical protein
MPSIGSAHAADEDLALINVDDFKKARGFIWRRTRSMFRVCTTLGPTSSEAKETNVNTYLIHTRPTTH